jgi:hypothetical protein
MIMNRQQDRRGLFCNTSAFTRGTDKVMKEVLQTPPGQSPKYDKAALMMEAVSSNETPVTWYQTTQSNISKESSPYLPP